MYILTQPTMSFPSFKTFLPSLITVGALPLGRCVVFINSPNPALAGFSGGIVTLAAATDYPDVFTRANLDMELTSVRFSGMFGDMTCVYTNGSWNMSTYNERTSEPCVC